jgi:hypothetical protein
MPAGKMMHHAGLFMFMLNTFSALPITIFANVITITELLFSLSMKRKSFESG